MKRFFFIGLLLTAVFFSCQKEEIIDDADLKNANQETNKESCFDFVYPITYIMPDGTTITGNSKEEITIAMKRWYNANPGAEERPTLQYPVEINFKGRILTINNDREMLRIKKACNDERPCFVFVYPITYILPDGSTITGNNKKEIGIAMKRWYAANPGVEERSVLQYPVEIKFVKDGNIVTINNDQQMQRIKASCD